MDIKMNGRLIKSIWWPDTDKEKDRNVESKNARLLELDASHHGDHDEFWVVEKSRITNEEIARYNLKYIETIIWK